jgi:hypothetical protein
MTTTKNAAKTTEDLQTLLTLAHQRAAKIEADATAEREQLERALRLAKGTADVQKAAAQAVAVVQSESLESQIRRALMSVDAPMTMPVLCKAVGASAGRVSATMREMRRANKVYNMGTEDHPRWIAVIGDNTPTTELNAWVKRLVSLAPFTFAGLLAATGARRGRVSGAIVQLQRDPKTRRDLQNLGNDRTYVWFLPTSPAVKR